MIRLILLYRRKLGIVGKGLLFDTGGYNIKTGMMELMKFDCGGAAAVFGAARAIAQLAPEGVEVHFVVAACEVRNIFVLTYSLCASIELIENAIVLFRSHLLEHDQRSCHGTGRYFNRLQRENH